MLEINERFLKCDFFRIMERRKFIYLNISIQNELVILEISRSKQIRLTIPTKNKAHSRQQFMKEAQKRGLNIYLVL